MRDEAKLKEQSRWMSKVAGFAMPFGGAALAVAIFTGGYVIGARRTRLDLATSGVARAESLHPPPATGQTGNAPPLTFYSTLTQPSSAAPEPANPRAPAQVAAAQPVAVKTTVPSVPPPAAKLPDRRVTQKLALQFGSFPTQKEARNLASSLEAHGLHARIVEAPLGNRGIWFRVRVGSYATSALARDAKEQLGAGGQTALVVKDD